MQINPVIRNFLDIVGYLLMAWGALTLILAIIAWIRGIAPALLRLGNGLAKRKIAVFAKGDNLTSLSSLIKDSNLFKGKIIEIAAAGDVTRSESEGATLFLVYWSDWETEIDLILQKKKPGTSLIVYHPQTPGSQQIPREKTALLDSHPNTILVNFRGRLLNDLVSSMITTSYK